MASQSVPSTWPFPSGVHGLIAQIPDRYWAPVAASAILTIIGAIAIAADEPLLFASLGPSAYLAAKKPRERSTTFYNVFVGHMTGLGAGFLAVFALGAWNAPTPFVNSYSLAPVRLFAVALAVLWSLFADSLLRVDHTATEATTILVATGFFRTGTDALMVIQAVAIMAFLSEVFRRLRAGRPPEQ
jgi:hypothetical protein